MLSHTEVGCRLARVTAQLCLMCKQTGTLISHNTLSGGQFLLDMTPCKDFRHLNVLQLARLTFTVLMVCQLICTSAGSAASMQQTLTQNLAYGGSCKCRS